MTERAELARRTTDLPVEAEAETIRAAIADGDLVLTAEPGAGKSSLVPLLAAESLHAGPDRRIVVLEPRRIAARATAHRLAELVGDGDELGGLVGLTIRGERRHSSRTVIEVMTEAVLTNRLQRDPELAGVAAVVFDEFHERNLHSDLGLAMAIEARDAFRDDLALVVMSATIDAGPIVELLATAGEPARPARTVAVAGRTHPVDTVHLNRPEPARWTSAVAGAVARAVADGPGDVLVFVPGRREIDRVSRAVADDLGRAVDVIGLHGGTDRATQRRVLGPGGGRRRVIVATAVAETSLTVPGIGAVVDGGLLRRARFDPATGLGRLETTNVTRFAADQRRGRAGRLGPGRCYRLWSDEDHRLLDESVPPAIVDGDPLPVAFELARWGDPDAAALPFLDRPDPARLAAGRRILGDLGLVATDGGLTERGRDGARLGLHPRLAALVLTGADVGQLRLAATAAAALDDDTWPTTVDFAAELDHRAGQLRRRADQILERVDRPAGTGRSDPGGGLGELLSRAWPDRIALARGGREGHYLLATGREAAIEGDGIGRPELAVVVEADGEVRRVRVRRAVPLDRPTVRRAVADRIRWTERVVWDERTSTVVAEREQRLDALVLHAEPLTAPDRTQVAAAVAEGITRSGVAALGWSDDATALRHRLAWLRATDERWPPVDDESLVDRLDDWVDASRYRPGDALSTIAVGASLLGILDWHQRSTFDELAPPALPTPSGRSRPLDYSTGRPVWSVRIQDLFGLDVHPRIGPTSTPVTVELLSPAGRPAQVTDDLPGFWRGTYGAVRADLRGRYPKHRWPTEPWLRQS